MKTLTKTLATGALWIAVSGASARADVAVTLNGQPLATSVSPLQLNGRTLVPMRDIFEALGATLSWNPVAQTITAQRELTTIQLAIDNPNALVNGRSVALEQPATLVNGRTFVPLRFVAEATGAQVDWNAPLQLISIRASGLGEGGPVIVQRPYYPPATNATPVDITPQGSGPVGAILGGTPAGGTQVAAARAISVPQGAVVPVTMDQALSSATARVGQTLSASVISRRLGDSEFPAGTKIEGRVIEARPSANNQPGVLDFDWTSALLPDGTRVPLRGELTSLDSSNVQMTGGRIVAPGARKDDNRLKVIGVGAGAGFVLGRVLGTNATATTILGAAGGYLLGRARERRAQEASVAANTTLGVRLTRALRYSDSEDYLADRAAFLRTASGASDRFDPDYYGFDTATAVPPGAAPQDDRYAGYDYADRLPAPAAGPNAVAGPNAPIYPEDVNGADDTPAPGNAPAERDAQFPDDPRFGDIGADDNAQATGDDRNLAGFQPISIPSGTVVPVTLDSALSSATSRVGETFTASVVSRQLGDSEFPAGSKIEGRVIEARPQAGSEPGTLDLEFRSAVLPDGTRIPLSGYLISLDDKSTQTENGRIVARAQSKKNDRLKVIGIGTAAGFVVGRVLKKDGILPSLLGALGGYLYGAKASDKPAEAAVPQGARLGVRLDGGVSYRDANNYGDYRARYLRQS